jgi:hypothetical protein
MNNVELKVTKQAITLCGAATAKVAEEGGDFVHATAPGVFLDVFPYNGHVICELAPEMLGKCDYRPNTRLDFDFRNKADNTRLLQNLRDAIDAALALNEYMEKGEENG